MDRERRIYRGELFFFVTSPVENREGAYRFYTDGALVIAEGKVEMSGDYAAIKTLLPDTPVTDYSGYLLMPGFIDAHVHYTQTEIIGMYGKRLLDWLTSYIYPAEECFSSSVHAGAIARAFLSELLRNGTTSCMAYASTYASSVSALFEAATEYDMRVMTGKTLMDREAPAGLTDTVKQGERECRALIERWHRKGRNSYVITPRFALTSTPEQLLSAGRLHKDYPDTYVQTHLSENKEEIRNVLSLYPDCRDYLSVYERAGLVASRSVMGHCVHLSDNECHRLADRGAVVAHCPTSNLFLGSGLFDMNRANKVGLRTVLATDVGAGTSFSMLRTMGEAYKIQQLAGYPMSSLEAFYKCTLGAACALGLDDKIGTLMPGCEADFIVVDCAATSIQQLRRDYLLRNSLWTVENLLFGLQTTGDDRNIKATYLMGRLVHGE